MRLPLAVLGLFLAAVPCRSNPFDDFRAEAGARFAVAGTAFAKDFGGLIGAADFHSARLPKLGGFDVGVSAAAQAEPSTDNTILRAAGVKAFGVPVVRAEAGLPFGFSVFARGVGFQGATLVGGGARYQVYKSGLVVAIPDVAVTLGYDVLNHSVLEISHVGGSVQASFNIPVVKPFVGVGYDSTEVKAKQPAAIAGAKATGRGERLTLGASLTPFPFTYLFGAYNLLHGESSVSLGLGVRFGGLL